MGMSRSEMQCVAYLTPEALKKQCLALVKSGEIGHFWAVYHEPDEDSKKVHAHLRMTPPPSRAVDWAAIAEKVVELVPFESLPRRLVLGKRATNNESEEGLLYARHESKYLRVKGLLKAVKDYPRDAFITDSEEWLDEQWSASDAFEPSPRKMTMQDLVELVESEICPDDCELLRLALLAGLNQGQWNMLLLYKTQRRKVATNGKPRT